MRKLFLLIVISLLTCSYLRAENPETKKLDSVMVSAPVRLFIFQGDSMAIRLRGDLDVKRFVDYHVKDGVLIVKAFPGFEEDLMKRDLIMYIVTPKGDKLNIEAGRGYTVKKLGGNHDKK